MRNKPTLIKNPPKSWWAGDYRIEKYMPPVTPVDPPPSTEVSIRLSKLEESTNQLINGN